MAHQHSIYDTDLHFIINPVTREIENQSGKIKIMQHDHNSERFTFQIPKEVDGHDMSLCNCVQIHYINIDSETKAQYEDVYDVEDLQISPDGDDTVICSWLISRNATQYAGMLSFVVSFRCIAEDGTEEYAWSTDIYSDITISAGIYNSDIVVAEYADILEQWRRTLFVDDLSESYTPEEACAMIGALAVGSDTLTWDGNTEGLESVAVNTVMFYKVSDALPSHEDIAQCGTFVQTQFEGEQVSAEITAETVESGDGYTSAFFGYILVIRENNTVVLGSTFPSKGIYFQVNQVGYISSFQINGYTGFPSHTHKATEVGAIPVSSKGAADGVASLDANGKVEAEQASSAINEQTGDYTLTLDDAGKLVIVDSASDCSVTVTYYEPDFPIGTEIEITQMGTGVVTIVADGVTLLSMDGMTSTAGQYAVVCLKKLDETMWLLGGALG